MRVSELNYDLLTDQDKIELVMQSIVDLSNKKCDSENMVDAVVILGASPPPMVSRINKAIKIYQNGWTKTIMLSGGVGWQRLINTPNEEVNNIKAEIFLKCIDNYYVEYPLIEPEDAINPEYWSNPQNEEIVKEAMEAGKRNREAFLKEANDYLKENGIKSDTGEDLTYEEIERDVNLKIPESNLIYTVLRRIANKNDDLNVYYENGSTNTPENAMGVKNAFDALNKKINKMIVVTSTFHCRRTLFTFKKYMPDVEVLTSPTDEINETYTKEIEEAINVLRNLYDVVRQDSEVDLFDLKFEEVLELFKTLPLEYDIEKYLKKYFQTIKDIFGEVKKLIEYTNNGSIADLELSEFLDDDMVKKIENNQRNNGSIRN